MSGRLPASARRPCAAFALLAAWAMTAAAQPYATPPLPAPPRPFAIAAPVEATLGNGLRVVVARREGVPLVSVALVVLSGAEVDPPRLSGLASMTAGLLTQGTRARSAPQIAAAAESLGGSLDSGAGWHQSTVSITVTTPRLDAALALVADVVMRPVFAPQELDRLRTQTLDALKLAYASPGTLADLVAERLTYGEGAYGHPAGGTPQSLPRISRGDLLALHAGLYRPDNAVLILAGDVTAEAGAAFATRHFGAWRKARAGAARPGAATAGAASPAEAAIVDMPQSGQAAVVVAIPLPPLTGGEPAIAAVLNAVLGGGYSSRLSQEIRIKRGLSYGASSGIEPRRSGALLRVTVQTKNESAAEVVGLVEAELDRLAAAPVEAAELEARKATLIGSIGRAVETSAGLAATIRGLIVTGRSPAELTTRIASVQAVGASDVQGYAAAHFRAAARRVAVAGEPAAFAAALRATRPGLLTVAADGLDLERLPDGAGR